MAKTCPACNRVLVMKGNECASCGYNLLDHMLNTPMKWYHKLPYWLVLGLIGYGVARLLGVV